MSEVDLLLFVSILLSIIYLVLAAVALSHVKENIKANRNSYFLIVDLWWPFYDVYDELGRKICIYGRVLLPLVIIAYVIWAIERFG